MTPSNKKRLGVGIMVVAVIGFAVLCAAAVFNIVAVTVANAGAIIGGLAFAGGFTIWIFGKVPLVDEDL